MALLGVSWGPSSLHSRLTRRLSVSRTAAVLGFPYHHPGSPLSLCHYISCVLVTMPSLFQATWVRSTTLHIVKCVYFSLNPPIFSVGIPQLASVQFSCSIVSDSLQPHGLQHSRPPCPSLTPRACSNSRPSSQLPELAQTHVHRVTSIQPTHPLSSPLTSTFNLSQHQDLFQSVSCLHQVAKVLEFQLQHQSFQ